MVWLNIQKEGAFLHGITRGLLRSTMKQSATLKQCHKCRSWDDCSGHWYRKSSSESYEYYKYQEFRYCRYQIRWVIKEFLVYDAGDIYIGRDTWPPEDKETGYQDVQSSTRNTSSQAPFEKIIQLIGEVTGRIEATGKDGQMLVLEVQDERENLSRAARDALNYCSGWANKGDYESWLWRREMRERIRKMASKLYIK